MRIRMGIALGLLLALTAGGCNSTNDNQEVATANGSSGARQSAAPNGTEDREKVLKFTQCMREHGIDMPDPEEGGAIKLPGVVDDPKKLDAAMQVCKLVLPNGGQPQKPDQQQLEQLRKVAQCMRENGVSKFPDPDPDTGIKAEGFDPNDPTFKKAQEACAKLQPGGASPDVQGTR